MQQGTTLPGVETDDEDRIVVHVDLDCFYAACERLREPALEGEPVVVGMGYDAEQPSGAVATASYEAREHGIESAQAISTAMDRLPRAAADGVDAEDDGAEEGSTDADAVGHYRPVDMAYYESIAAEIKAILHDCAETVREVSIDEAYLDVTERTDWSVVEGYARHVKQRIDREVGLTASVGVAPTMHAAKVASDHDKPDGLVVVEPGEVEGFLAPLPIDELHGIGPVTAGTLREHGIETVADLADADREWVREQWGDRGFELHERARGIDPRVVEPRGRPKSLSRESSLGGTEADFEVVEERIRALAEAVADRARSKAALYRTIGIKVVLPPFDVNTRARSLPGPVDDPELVEEVALDLLEEFEGETPRKVGVRVSNLSFADADQSTLGGWEGEASSGSVESAEADTAETGAVEAGAIESDTVGPEAIGSDGVESDGVASDGVESDGVESDDVASDGVEPSPVETNVGESDSAAVDTGEAATSETVEAAASETVETATTETRVARDAVNASESGIERSGTLDDFEGTGAGSTDGPSGPASVRARNGGGVQRSPDEVRDHESGEVQRSPEDEEQPGQSVLDRVWSDGPAEHADPEPIGQPPDQTTLSEFE